MERLPERRETCDDNAFAVVECAECGHKDHADKMYEDGEKFFCDKHCAADFNFWLESVSAEKTK